MISSPSSGPHGTGTRGLRQNKSRARFSTTSVLLRGCFNSGDRDQEEAQISPARTRLKLRLDGLIAGDLAADCRGSADLEMVS